MPSKEYYEGREMENNMKLHSHLINIFKFDSIESDGASTTKGDIIANKDGVKIPISLKNVSGKNTQVHLTTLKKLSEDLNMPVNIKTSLNLWLGTNDKETFDSWLTDINLSNYEKDHYRLSSKNIKNWQDVENWFNSQKEILSNLLIESLKKDRNKSKILLWHNKKSKMLQIVDIPKLIKFINKDCKWITMPSGTTLRCVTPNNKPILWLQMKGNRTDNGYNHSPQFHITENWPEDIVLYKDKLI